LSIRRAPRSGAHGRSRTARRTGSRSPGSSPGPIRPRLPNAPCAPPALLFSC